MDHLKNANSNFLAEASILIEADIASCFTYASFQNAIPVLRSIVLHNTTADNLLRCTLELTSNPPFFRPKIWTIDRLSAGEKISVTDRRIDLDAAYLDGLDEAERGVVRVRFLSKETLLSEQVIDVRLLARDEWGGVADMAQLLPAFVMPNDPAVAKIMKAAADQLSAHGHSSGLDGYQSHDPKRAFMLLASIYSAVAGMSLHYAEPPASFEKRGQKIRRPSTILDQGLATCLDTTLLFCAAIEAAGLNPVILMFEGHAAAGVWLRQRSLAKAVEHDAMEIRKALAAKELIVFETTAITHRPPMLFDNAQRIIERRLEEESNSSFVAAIDVRRARSGGITPLASHEPVQEAIALGSDDMVHVPLPAMPNFGDMPVDEVEIKPTTAAGRIERWQRKLLDLTLRNRLLNLSDTKKTIPFVCPDIGYLEDRLAAEQAIRLVSLPEQNPLGERDESLYRDMRGMDIHRSFAAEALQRDELASPLGAKVLEARLIELYRQVRNDFAEGGANTLFLAVGFLRWKKKAEDEKTYRAPLLLVPVKLERRSATSKFTLRFHEDETRFNATLLQFLERDFDLRLPQFAGELPVDENGIDVPLVLSRMRQAIRDVPGMEVIDETALSTFSFAKFLMWKDLVERTDVLRENRVVKHLIDTPQKAFNEGRAALCEEVDVDRNHHPADVVSLLPADSSQLAASISAAEGSDFLIIGPPGTGKSQTITNMIANCLSAGKTVLFVAEKTAALDVVHRRLREHGLGDHCLELHSSKTDRKRFFAQLRASWENSVRSNSSEWVEINDRLKLHRDQLNAYVEALHRTHPNGLTPYQMLGFSMKESETYAPSLSWHNKDAHDVASRVQLEELATDIGRTFAVAGSKPNLRSVNIENWSFGWQQGMLAAANDLHRGCADLARALSIFLGQIGLPVQSDSPLQEIIQLRHFAQTLHDNAGMDVSIMFAPDFAKLRQAHSELADLIDSYQKAAAKLSSIYSSDDVSRIPIDELDLQWRNANASYWPMSWVAGRRVQKLLKSYAKKGDPDPSKDLPLLRKMHSYLAAIDNNLLAIKSIGFSGLDTDMDAVELLLEKATQLRNAVAMLGRPPQEIRTIFQVIAPVISGAMEPDTIRAAAANYLSAFAGFSASLALFKESAGTDPLSKSSRVPLADLVETISHLQTSKDLLRDWSSWCRVRNKAVANGLVALVDGLEAGKVRHDETGHAFKLAYARWWLPLALDSEPDLREFRRFNHDHAIERFRHYDELVRAKAAARVGSTIAHGLPPVQTVPRNSELGLLRHQMELQRPTKSIREVIGSMPSHFGRLAPCMLMSPLSIAQYLPPDKDLFDVVIFDEASQITTWDAIGAIARGRQTIIVGDPKQLPPTNFFGRSESEEDVVEHEKDLESILDETKASGLPVRYLRWHYRSRNESLIAFSNHHYYGNKLITFPGPNVEDRAVQLRHILNGIYDTGKSRTNRIEAEAIAREAVNRMEKALLLPEAKRSSLGIITFNQPQQALIEDLLDKARRDNAALEWFFAEDRYEKTIVKNLENVQGDERDIILFSITYTKDAAGKLSMGFGALNGDGGERRLNVAVTRARQELIVFSGITCDQIDTSRTKAIGVHHLKTFLDFAQRGAIALPAEDKGSVGGFDSPFEEAVAEELVRLGWQIVPQIGVSGFRVDLGVRHPDKAGAYLAGVECDGATYHSAATARDRDKVREQVLRGLGWEIERVWSTDWWFDKSGAISRLNEALTKLLEQSRASAAKAELAGEKSHLDSRNEIKAGEPDSKEQDTRVPPADVETSSHQEEMIESVLTQEVTFADRAQIKSLEVNQPVEAVVFQPNAIELSSKSNMQKILATYRHTDLSMFRAEPAKFFEPDYRATLQRMVDQVVETEAPVRVDILSQRIARAHGWLRTGTRIREHIARHLHQFDKTSESSGEFLWAAGTIVECLEYRPPDDEKCRRSISEVPIAELTSVVMANRQLLHQTDPAIELARLLCVERLAAPSRSRLEEAIARANALI